MTVHEQEANRLKDIRWIGTFTGKRFFPLDPRPGDVCIEDIAHALSMKCRYTGHCSRFYSVAEHCVRVSLIVPVALQLPALLHDAAEAYLPDIASPIKGSINIASDIGGWGSFRLAEAYLLGIIFEGLGVCSLRFAAGSDRVKKADLVMLATEVRDLLPFSTMSEDPKIEDWGLTEKPHEFGFHDPLGWTPQYAEQRFLARFRELTS